MLVRLAEVMEKWIPSLYSHVVMGYLQIGQVKAWTLLVMFKVDLVGLASGSCLTFLELSQYRPS